LESIFNIAFKVILVNPVSKIVINIKTRLVFGFLSKLKNGPMIINIRPSIEEMKNLGKRKVFSQKSGIVCF
jgi:hypothetical protein